LTAQTGTLVHLTPFRIQQIVFVTPGRPSGRSAPFATALRAGRTSRYESEKPHPKNRGELHYTSPRTSAVLLRRKAAGL